MIFSHEKSVSLKNRKGKGLNTFLTAMLIASAFFVPYIITGHGYFMFYGDFNVQQIPFYKMCHDMVRSGNFGWNIYTDLGSDFISSYSFYLLGSPFFWLTVPFPSEFVPYLMGPLLILKFSLAALTAYLYIKRFVMDPRTAEIGALLYAFSGFSVYNIFFNHFHESLIIFPLLLLSLELLMTENRHGLFGLTVFLAAVSNYFFFFGMVVFTAIYFFVRVISKSVKVRFSRFLAIFLEAVLGLAAAMILLLPTFYTIIGNARVSNINSGWNAIMYGKEQIYLNIIECFFFPPDLPARPVFFPNADVKWSSLGGWMPVFGMAGVLAYCSGKKKDWLKRMITVCAFMAFIPILNSAFYAFNTSYYARWFYMPILLMCLATASAAEDRDLSWRGAFRTVSLITLAFTLVIGFFPQKKDGKLIFGLYSNAGENIDYTVRFFVTCGIAAAGLGLLALLIKCLKKNRTLFYRLAVLFVALVTVVYANCFIYKGKQQSYSTDNVIIPQLIEGNVKLDNSDTYRIDTYDGIDNTGMFLRLPTINAFQSTVNPSIMDYYDFIGVTRDVASRPDTKYYSIRSLLSVKYLLNRDGGDPFVNEDNEAAMEGYRYYKTLGGYYIYENENYIPYGFSYEYYVSKSYLETNYKGVKRADMMLKAIVLSDEDAEKYKYILKNIADVTAEPEEEPLPDPERNPGDYVEESEQSDEVSESPESPITEKKKNINLGTDYKTLSDDAKRLAETSAEDFKYDNKGFSATVERDETTLVFFSVPYSDGFTATVNGKKAEIVKANVGFMAVLVPAGESEIRFDYKTPLFKEGAIISGAAVIIFIAYLIIAALIKRSKEEDEYYPEGEMLLEKWQEYRLSDAAYELPDITERVDILDGIADFGNIGKNIGTKDFSGGFNIDTSGFENKNDGT